MSTPASSKVLTTSMVETSKEALTEKQQDALPENQRYALTLEGDSAGENMCAVSLQDISGPLAPAQEPWSSQGQQSILPGAAIELQPKQGQEVVLHSVLPRTEEMGMYPADVQKDTATQSRGILQGVGAAANEGNSLFGLTEDELMEACGAATIELQQRGTRGRGRGTKLNDSMMKKWISSNRAHPYPTTAEKKHFAVLSGHDESQVDQWFRNWRKRQLHNHSVREDFGEDATPSRLSMTRACVTAHEKLRATVDYLPLKS